MWYELLPKILNMSLTGSAVILVVLLARLLLRRAPKVFSYALWAVVLFRLLCPVSVTSDFSAFNLSNNTTQSSPVDYFQYNGKTEKPMLEFGTDNSAPAASAEKDTAAVNSEVSAHHTPDVFLPVYLTIWLFGVAVMLGYSVISYFPLRRRLVGAVCLRDNIYLADGISSPFVMGLVRPKIYLPSTLSEKEQKYILLHEQHHIRRCDHVVKLLSFAALCVHWFNPLVWMAFVLSGKDMEMSCDEAVIKKLGGDIRADYSASLLSLATGRRIISGTPLAFGEGDTGGRIRNVLNYKKPAFWVIVVAVIACVAVVFSLATNQKTSIRFIGSEYEPKEVLYDESSTLTPDTAPLLCIGADGSVYLRAQPVSYNYWEYIGELSKTTMSRQERYALFPTLPNKLHENIDKVTDVYRLDYEGGSYLVMQTSGKYVLLTQLTNEKAGWTLAYESYLNNNTADMDYYMRSLEMAVGENVDAFAHYETDKKPGFVVIGFAAGESGTQSEMTDMGYAVFMRENGTFRLMQLQVYPNAAVSKSGIYMCEHPAVLSESGQITDGYAFHIVLSKNEALRSITRTIHSAGKADETLSYAAFGSPDMVVLPWLDETGADSVSMYFYDEHGNEINVDTGTLVSDSASTTKDSITDLDTAISAAILSQTGSGKEDGLIHVESHVVFNTVNTPDEASKPDSDFTVTAYALVLEQTYSTYGGELSEVGGSYIPTALTFRCDTAGNYTLTEYWIPRDGSDYASDIKEKFPVEAAKQALDDQQYVERLQKECLEKAQAHLNSNGSIDEAIAALLETICSSPSVSSNPGDAIKAHQAEFDTLVGYGEQTLRYCFGEFLLGGQTNLRGHIMGAACEKIVKNLGQNTIDLGYANGQEWFDAFQSGAHTLQQQFSGEDLEKCYPATWLLLQLTQE